jgi:HEAT repeat protein
MERKRDVAGIIQVLRTGSVRARRAAANTLIRLPDPRSVEALAEALTDNDDSLLRRNAAIALGEIQDAGSGREAQIAHSALILGLADGDSTVRTMAAASLSRTRPTEALTPLIRCLDDADQAVRKTAAVALRGYEDPRAAEALAR